MERITSIQAAAKVGTSGGAYASIGTYMHTVQYVVYSMWFMHMQKSSRLM